MTYLNTDAGETRIMTQFAQRISRLSPSPIREILQVIDQPGMISFAGGLPASDSFPSIEVSSLNHHQLQYGATEGDLNIRQFIAGDLAKRGLQTDPDHVLVLSGSQQGIDLVAKLMIEQGTRVAVESPTYLAALQVFTLFGAAYEPFTPQTISALGAQAPTALTYTVPTFQNPTGHCYSTEQRQALADYCDSSGSVLFEDDPYRELVYNDCDSTPVCSHVKEANWIYQSSFSKTLAPGLRLGYLVCSPDLFPTLSWLKQAADLHSNRLSQHIVLSQLESDSAVDRLVALRKSYREKRDAFDIALNQQLFDVAQWQTPAGGLFFWLSLNSDKAIDTRELLVKALQRDVAFMPGEPFFSDGRAASNCIRLNFSHAQGDEVNRGLLVLAELLDERL